jgi:hypothetical protein
MTFSNYNFLLTSSPPLYKYHGEIIKRIAKYEIEGKKSRETAPVNTRSQSIETLSSIEFEFEFEFQLVYDARNMKRKTTKTTTLNSFNDHIIYKKFCDCPSSLLSVVEMIEEDGKS